MRFRAWWATAAIAVGVATQAPSADAFCGFYVGGAGAKLFNDATVVVLMREGTKTVLSMQNAYKGPPEKFAMVVPVPVVLQKENVKTLPRDLFDKIDQLASPRLVEYWEQDPCYQPPPMPPPSPRLMKPSAAAAAAPAAEAKDLGVKIEAKFAVGEYEVVILSAKDSGGLETWLHQEKYTIPDGAEPYFRPYVQSGSKFFVARVDISKVKMENGQAVLSPLRFHYDADTFSLPVRLGLINSSGTQDLIVHVLARGKRYEVANYPNVTIPTNLDVSEKAKASFPTFYTTLLDATLEKNPKAVVTEYAWDASTCDPCPGPALYGDDLATLGLDVIDPQSVAPQPTYTPPPPPPPKGCEQPYVFDAQGVKHYKPECVFAQPMRKGGSMFFGGSGGFTLTRLHARYTKETLGKDLVFREASPITGGREVRDAKANLESGATPASMNNFQARYAVRHPWTGPITCKDPRRGIWGGPPAGTRSEPLKVASKLGLAPRAQGATLASFLAGAPPDLAQANVAAPLPSGATSAAPESVADLAVTKPADAGTIADAGITAEPEKKKGCAGCATVPSSGSAAWLAPLVGLAALALRRRR